MKLPSGTVKEIADSFQAVKNIAINGLKANPEMPNGAIRSSSWAQEGLVKLLNPQGKYEQTLQVLGDDPEWYSELTEWWKFYGKRQTIDGITGATISGGERAVRVITIEDSKLNKGYKIRFETAVEDNKYYTQDAEVELKTENLNTKINGKGYIRYVRIMAND